MQEIYFVLPVPTHSIAEKMIGDYVMTIESDEEDFSSKVNSKVDQDETKLDPEFVFDLTGDPYFEFGSNVLTQDLVQSGSKPASETSFLLSIQRLRLDVRLQYLWTISLLDGA